MVDSYEVVDLADWTRGESEPGGDEAKRWFIAPETSPHAGHWLFKPRRIKTLELSKERQHRGDKPDVLVRGEDWAEKISYESPSCCLCLQRKRSWRQLFSYAPTNASMAR